MSMRGAISNHSVGKGTKPKITSPTLRYGFMVEKSPTHRQYSISLRSCTLEQLCN